MSHWCAYKLYFNWVQKKERRHNKAKIKSLCELQKKKAERYVVIFLIRDFNSIKRKRRNGWLFGIVIFPSSMNGRYTLFFSRQKKKKEKRILKEKIREIDLSKSTNIHDQQPKRMTLRILHYEKKVTKTQRSSFGCRKEHKMKKMIDKMSLFIKGKRAIFIDIFFSFLWLCWLITESMYQSLLRGGGMNLLMSA